MGFCFFNNVAIAARYLQNKWGVRRIGIVDFDVHHGNGTQTIFEDDPSVFFYSIHEHPSFAYPGTGREFEKGQARVTDSLSTRRYCPDRETWSIKNCCKETCSRLSKSLSPK